jgi:hypothetical protein
METTHKSIVAKRLILPNDIEALEAAHIVELIRSYPITCTRYYDHRTSAFRELLKNDDTIIGKIINSFFNTEFQGCGSEHDHGVVWIDSVPIYKMNSNEKSESFIDKYITCDKSLLPLCECFLPTPVEKDKQKCSQRVLGLVCYKIYMF